MARRPQTDNSTKVRRRFKHENLEVKGGEIRVYFIRDSMGLEWVPFGSGPLYRQSAIDYAAWLARHIEGFRSLLPKGLRGHRIVFGELNCRTYPGQFYPMALPPSKEETVTESG